MLRVSHLINDKIMVSVHPHNVVAWAQLQSHRIIGGRVDECQIAYLLGHNNNSNTYLEDNSNERKKTQLEIVSQLYTFQCFPSWPKLCSRQSPAGVWGYVYMHVEYFDLQQKAMTLW